MKRETKAILVLSLLSPFFAEVLSGSTPPLEAMNPIAFALLWGFYGAGVVLVREAWVRWGRNYLRLMLLGFLYGVVEEGLVIKSWFNPDWPDLDVFAHYGRVWGINTVWAVWLTIFHSIMSIASPIIIWEMIYPEFKNESLLSEKGIKLAALVFILSALPFFSLLVPYRPPFVQYSLTILLAVLLFLAARRVRRERIFRKRVERHHLLYGAGVALALFLTYTALPHSSINPIVPMILGALIALHFYSQMDESSSIPIILGFLFFWFVPYDIILEINGVLGEAVLGILTFSLLFWKWRKSKFLYPGGIESV